MTITVSAFKINNNPNNTKCCDLPHDLSSGVKYNPSFGALVKTHDVGETTEKLVKWFGKCSTPMNRFILGVAAVMIQPWIDLHNKDVDEKTRKVSRARTIAKNIAGVATGIPIRILCIKSIDALTRTPEELKRTNKSKTSWNTALIPDKVLNKDTQEWVNFTDEHFGEALRLVKKHREAIGSTVALVVMLFTNFALDVPITKYLTNKLIDKDEAKNNKKINTKGGNA